jgi:aminoglycoside phosphotransferase (APT) family kinase protein
MQDLLRFLAEQRPEGGRFHDWQFQRVSGSANNLLYQATNDTADLAIKFTIRDARHRARREYQALLALQEAGVDLAPQPIWLDESSYPLPVVVQSWVAGEVTAAPPQTDAAWQLLIEHYARIAQVAPERVTGPLGMAVMNFTSIRHAQQHIQQQLASIPHTERPASLQKLLSCLSAAASPLCSPAPSLALCRNDSNTLNFIRRSGKWLSVDWENSGWGDPAFEIADVICHPQYASVPSERWQWVMQLYGQLSEDETVVSRIRTYTPLMLVWWVSRLARAAYEVPRGLDQRLVERPANWQTQNQALYERYVQLATDSLAQLR